jgi:probable F420-dependent oxidoreductase
MKKRWSLSVPMDGFALPELADVARDAERLGYTDSWSFEVDGVDAFTPLAVIGLATSMRIGTAIANVYTRGPATLASTAAGLADVAPGRFVLGIGAGSQPIVESWNGGKFGRPATRVREMAQFLRSALAGERVVFKGETFTVDGFRLTRVPKQPVPIHVAALREGMLKVAGEVGDGVILNWLSPDDVPRSVGVVRAAARAAGRDPETIEVTARLFVNLDPPGPESDLVVRRHIAGYLNVPVYRAFQEWLGRSEVLGPMWQAWGAGDRRGAVAAIPDHVIADLMPRGTLAELKARIQLYLDRGIDTAFLSLMTTEPDPKKKRDLMLNALRVLAPGAR